MAYVRANTAPTFGARFQSLSPLANRLGAYIRASFPLPTTSMSTPLRLSRLGDPGAFYEGPYPSYPQPEHSRTRATATGTMSGEWVPPGPPPRALFQQGALTYRIDPRTGQYKFSASDLLPRGVWQQNVFQHPVRPALSALGVQVQARGVQLVQIGNRQFVMKTTPVRRAPRGPLARMRQALSGALGGCNCGGNCRGLGDTACAEGQVLDADGNCSTADTFSCPAGMVLASDGTCQAANSSTAAAASSVAGALQQVASALAPRPAIVAAPPATSWLNGSINIAGAQIPNLVIAGGGIMLAIAAAASGGRRR